MHVASRRRWTADGRAICAQADGSARAHTQLTDAGPARGTCTHVSSTHELLVQGSPSSHGPPQGGGGMLVVVDEVVVLVAVDDVVLGGDEVVVVVTVVPVVVVVDDVAVADVVVEDVVLGTDVVLVVDVVVVVVSVVVVDVAAVEVVVEVVVVEVVAIVVDEDVVVVVAIVVVGGPSNCAVDAGGAGGEGDRLGARTAPRCPAMERVALTAERLGRRRADRARHPDHALDHLRRDARLAVQIDPEAARHAGEGQRADLGMDVGERHADAAARVLHLQGDPVPHVRRRLPHGRHRELRACDARRSQEDGMEMGVVVEGHRPGERLDAR